MDLDICGKIGMYGGLLESEGNARVKASSMELGSIGLKTEKNYIDADGFTRKDNFLENIGSEMNFGGNLKLDIAGNVVLKGSSLNAIGDTDVKVGGNIELLSSYNEMTSHGEKVEHDGKKENKTTKEIKEKVGIGSSFLVGGSLKLGGGGDLILEGVEFRSGRKFQYKYRRGFKGID